MRSNRLTDPSRWLWVPLLQYGKVHLPSVPMLKSAGVVCNVVVRLSCKASGLGHDQRSRPWLSGDNMSTTSQDHTLQLHLHCRNLCVRGLLDLTCSEEHALTSEDNVIFGSAWNWCNTFPNGHWLVRYVRCWKLNGDNHENPSEFGVPHFQSNQWITQGLLQFNTHKNQIKHSMIHINGL